MWWGWELLFRKNVGVRGGHVVAGFLTILVVVLYTFLSKYNLSGLPGNRLVSSSVSPGKGCAIGTCLYSKGTAASFSMEYRMISSRADGYHGVC